MLQEAGEVITSVAIQALGSKVGPSDIMLTADFNCVNDVRVP